MIHSKINELLMSIGQYISVSVPARRSLDISNHVNHVFGVGLDDFKPRQPREEPRQPRFGGLNSVISNHVNHEKNHVNHVFLIGLGADRKGYIMTYNQKSRYFVLCVCVSFGCIWCGPDWIEQTIQ